MKTKYTIRPANVGDVPAIAAIYDDHVLHRQASFEYDPPGPAEMQKRFQTITEAGFPYLVAIDEDSEEGNLLGYAYAGAFHPRKAYERTVENSVYLAPEAQEKGIGKALMHKLIAACKERGYLQMIALITVLDPPISIEFHRKLGFRDVGRLTNVGYKHGKWLDVCYMQLPLSSDLPE